jgi:hypothetical protein
MANDKVKSNSPGWGDLKFAQWNWNEETDHAYNEWLKSHAPDLGEALTYLVEQSYRVTISFDHDSGSPKVSATGIGKKHVNENICITSWGEDTEDCILLTIFKIDVLFEGKTAPTRGERKTGRR